MHELQTEKPIKFTNDWEHIPDQGYRRLINSAIATQKGAFFGGGGRQIIKYGENAALRCGCSIPTTE